MILFKHTVLSTEINPQEYTMSQYQLLFIKSMLQTLINVEVPWEMLLLTPFEPKLDNNSSYNRSIKFHDNWNRMKAYFASKSWPILAPKRSKRFLMRLRHSWIKRNCFSLFGRPAHSIVNREVVTHFLLWRYKSMKPYRFFSTSICKKYLIFLKKLP